MTLKVERFERKIKQLMGVYLFRLLFFVPALILLISVFQEDVGFLR